MAYRKPNEENWLCNWCDLPVTGQTDHSGCTVRNLGTTPAFIISPEIRLYGQVVSECIDTQENKLEHGILGIAGEAGEIADLWKKFKFKYRNGGKPRTEEAFLAELGPELGDLLFYLALAYNEAFGGSLSDLAQQNIKKLQQRYADKFGAINPERMEL